VAVNEKEKSLEIIPPTDGSNFEVTKNVNLDLSDKNIYFKVRVNDTSDLRGFDIYLSNDGWAKYVRYNVKNSTE